MKRENKKKLTHNEYVNLVKEKWGNEYIILDTYNGVTNKILVKHNSSNCNFCEKNIYPMQLLNGNGCKICFDKSRTKTTEEFKKECYNLYGDEYLILGDYKNNKTKIKIKHNCDDCNNYEFEKLPNAFIYSKQICPKCSFKQKTEKQKMSNETFLNKLFEVHGEKYTALEEYKGSGQKIKIRHNNLSCENYEWYTSPSVILKGCNCPKCSNKYTKTHNEFVEEVYNLVGDEYEIIGEYKNTRNKIKIKHNNEKCLNNEWLCNPTAFLSGTRCPICNESKGERKIRDFLNNNNIKFETEFIFEDLNSDINNPLRFDFGIIENNNIKYLIEYDGEFHYKWIKSLCSYKKFITLQYHDRLKNEYCLKNNIELIRIPYWNFDNIEEILSKELL